MAEEAFARKKNVRAAHRASATRLSNQAEALMGTTPVNADELNLLQTNLSKKPTILEDLNWSSPQKPNWKRRLGEQMSTPKRYRERCCRSVGTVGTLPTTTPTATGDPHHDTTREPPRDLHPREPPRDPDPDPTPAATGGGAAASSKVKLPKISLPHFKGNPLYWTAFWDSYESAVHRNSALSEVDKFNYLRSLLEKSAYEAIAGLTLSSANYGEAIEILKKRFGNRQMIISRHMDVLLNLSVVSGEHDLKGLRWLYNEVEANVRSLKLTEIPMGPC